MNWIDTLLIHTQWPGMRSFHGNLAVIISLYQNYKPSIGTEYLSELFCGIGTNYYIIAGST